MTQELKPLLPGQAREFPRRCRDDAEAMKQARLDVFACAALSGILAAWPLHGSTVRRPDDPRPAVLAAYAFAEAMEAERAKRLGK